MASTDRKLSKRIEEHQSKISALIPASKSWIKVLAITLVAIGIFSSLVYIKSNLHGLSTSRLGETSVQVQCPKSSPEDRPPVECWEDIIKKTIATNGINGAFELLSTIYETDPGFGTNCHIFAHLIGYEAYREFAKKKTFDFEVTPATSLCGFGFYHGFMTILIGSGRDIGSARKFCMYINSKLSKDSPGVAENCYHGIGHGAAEDPDKNLWGNAKELIKQTAKVCRSISSSANDRAPCYDGLFMGLAGLYAANEYGFTIDSKMKTDPYRLCNEQPEELKNSCYRGMKLIIFKISNFKLIDAAKFVETIPYDEPAKAAIMGLAGDLALKEIKNTDHDALFLTCRSLSEYLRSSCLKGVILVFAENSDFKEPTQQLFAICENKLFTLDEKNNCYQTAIFGFKYVYPAKKVAEICSFIKEERYRNYCL